MIKVVAVCACPAGIAHTYMAAESLERAAKKNDFQIKVETDGASGVENRLTPEDIATADYVVLAVDTKVDTSRFEGKEVIEVSVTDAIRNVKSIVEKIKA